MNLHELHTSKKEVSALALFKGKMGVTTAIQIEQNAVLKEHTTPTPALLLCVVGWVTYKDETNQEISLQPGDYIPIAANIKHWIEASEKSQLVLIR